jgi:hypothetical protein
MKPYLKKYPTKKKRGRELTEWLKGWSICQP